MAWNSILVLVFCFIYNAESILLPFGWTTPKKVEKDSLKKCVPSDTTRSTCTVCVCNTDGVFICRPVKCIRGSSSNNFTNYHLPEIHEGQRCVVGNMYRAGCNTCRCENNNKLMCTKMACLQEGFAKSLKKYHQKLNESEMKFIKDKKILRTEQSLHGSLAEPSNVESCRPGKLYKKLSQTCFCNYLKTLICTEHQDKTSLPTSSKLLKEFPFKSEAIITFPVLNTLSDKCEPGKMYRIDCNGCLCQEFNNLICEEKLCLSRKDLIKIEAKKRSGNTCKQDENHGCVKCKCVNQISECKAIPKCEQREKLSGHSARLPLSLNPQKDKCTPGTMYSVQCNQCYCQADYALRCTQKTCLNYAQALKLQKQRDHLEQRGL